MSDDVTSDIPPIGVELSDEWVPNDAKATPIARLTAVDGGSVVGKGWTVEQIADGLQMMSFAGSAVASSRIGAELTMTDAEAKAIAEPLTRIVNRRPLLRRAASEGGDVVDVIQVAIATAPYGIRVAGEAIEARRMQREAVEVSAAGDVA